MVKDIWNGNDDADISAGVTATGRHYFPVVGDSIFFAAHDGIHGEELWKSDGTANGTVMVKDINPGNYTQPGSSGSWPNSAFGCGPYMTAVGDLVYFRAYDETNGIEVWKSDGTADGTVRVTDLDFSPSFATCTNTQDVGRIYGNVGDTVFFLGHGGPGGGTIVLHRRYHRRHGAADAGVQFGIQLVQIPRRVGFRRLGRDLPLLRVFN